MAETKIRVNSLEKIEQILQETYDLTVKEINEIQNEMNKLMNSSPLADATFEDKARYAKAMHDFIKDKTKAIEVRLDIAKLWVNSISTTEMSARPSQTLRLQNPRASTSRASETT